MIPILVSLKLSNDLWPLDMDSTYFDSTDFDFADFDLAGYYFDLLVKVALLNCHLSLYFSERFDWQL